MKKLLTLCLILLFTLLSCKNKATKNTSTTNSIVKKDTIKNKPLRITPVKHATTVLEFQDEVIYLDPTGGRLAFQKFPTPTYIFITDIHGDHLNIETLDSLNLSETHIIGPKAVIDKIENIKAKEKIILNNDDFKDLASFSVKAIPMYNLRKEEINRHPKGRGNGYLFTINEERIYFSGDTEDIPEMRNLKNIDKAFICMNLPYTMTVEKAASAVLDFKPKQVYPFHYRGKNGFSDTNLFKKLVNTGDKNIDVILWDWYSTKN